MKQKFLQKLCLVAVMLSVSVGLYAQDKYNANDLNAIADFLKLESAALGMQAGNNLKALDQIIFTAVGEDPDWEDVMDRLTASFSKYLVWTTDATDKRLTEIKFQFKGNLKGALDLSGCMALKMVDMTNSTQNMTGVNFTGCVVLEKVILSNTNTGSTFEALTLDSHPALKELSLAYCKKIASLNLAACPALEKLVIGGGGLSGTDPSVLTSISNIPATLTVLELQNAPNLPVMAIPGSIKELTLTGMTQFTGINLSACTGLTKLVVKTTPVTALSFAGLTALKTVEFDNLSQVGPLDFSPCSALTDLTLKYLPATATINATTVSNKLSCTYNGLSSIDLINCTAPTVEISNCANLTNVAITNNTKVTGLTINNNALLQAIDVTGCSNLSTANLGSNANLETITGLNGNIKLTSVTLYTVPKLAALDVSACSNLTSVTVNSTALTTLSIADCAKLTTLNYSGCSMLTTLNKTGATAITSWTGDVSGLSGVLDLSGITAAMVTVNVNNSKGITAVIPPANVTNLNISNCNITGTLDITSLAKLNMLTCSFNKNLTAITGVANNTVLKTLNIQETGLTALDATGTLFTNFNAFNCRLSELKLASNIAANTNTQVYGNKLRFSTLPLRDHNNGTSYQCMPQDTIRDGVVHYVATLDALKNEYKVTYNETDYMTVYKWWDVTSSPRTEITDITVDANGIIHLPESVIGKKLRCEMSNPFFKFTTITGTESTTKALVYEVEITDPIKYDSHDANALKTFLTQESGEAGKTNFVQLDIPDVTIDETENWLDALSNFEYVYWNDETPKRLTAVVMNTRKLNGKLDLSDCISLETVELAGNNLMADSLIISGCSALNTLNLKGNTLFKGIEFGQNSALKTLDVSNCALTSLDLSACTALDSLVCNYSKIIKLDNLPASLVHLNALSCTALTSIDLAGCTLVADVLCGNSVKLKTMSNLPASLIDLEASGCNLTTLDFTPCLNIELIKASNNMNLVVSGLNGKTKLTELQLEGCKLSQTLDVSGCSSLSTLNCAPGMAASTVEQINLEGTTSLSKLNCSGTLVSSFNPAHFYVISELIAGNTKLSGTLDVSEVSTLKKLAVSSNSDLSAVNLSGSKETLSWVEMSGCQFTELDFSGYTKISYLDCQNNKSLEKLTVTSPLLSALYANNCKINEIHIDETLPSSVLSSVLLDGNALKFSTLPLLSGRTALAYSWGNQSMIQAGKKPYLPTSTDLQSEYSFGGNVTTFQWYEVVGNIATETDVVTVDSEGIIHYPASVIGKTLQCKMRNASFPDYVTANRCIIYEVEIDIPEQSGISKANTDNELVCPTHAKANELISVSSANTDLRSISIFSVGGTLVDNIAYTGKEIQFNAPSVNGIYMLQIVDIDGNVRSRKIVVR